MRAEAVDKEAEGGDGDDRWLTVGSEELLGDAAECPT